METVKGKNMQIPALRAIWLGLTVIVWLPSSGFCFSETLIREISVSSSNIEPGHVLKISVSSARQDLEVKVSGCGQNIPLAAFPEAPRDCLGYLAVPLTTSPGTVSINLTASDGRQSQTQAITVKILPAAKRRVEILHIENYSELKFEPESRLMARLRAHSALRLEKPLEQFSSPLPGGKSNCNFGVKRVYRPSNLTSVHRGVDMDAPAGTEICAPADGVVLLARKFKAHGNTTLVDHGLGVVTTFLHQSRILVKPGQRVGAGEVIGKVGSTGASTGPHLHFQINIHGIVVDPDDFLQAPANPLVVVYSSEEKAF
jgi:murein DD-endopeptidase MepM/ murein hydrolase activator NlpD